MLIQNREKQHGNAVAERSVCVCEVEGVRFATSSFPL